MSHHCHRNSPTQLQKKWAADRAATAAALGITETQATEILKALPFSSIPDWDDVLDIVRLVRETG